MVGAYHVAARRTAAFVIGSESDSLCIFSPTAEEKWEKVIFAGGLIKTFSRFPHLTTRMTSFDEEARHCFPACQSLLRETSSSNLNLNWSKPLTSSISSPNLQINTEIQEEHLVCKRCDQNEDLLPRRKTCKSWNPLTSPTLYHRA